MFETGGPEIIPTASEIKQLPKTSRKVYFTNMNICSQGLKSVCGTVADKKNVAFSHQNNLFGLNKSNERMSRIYNRILNG